ncbi:MAG: cyanoexosortase A system-associated protein [Nostocaceae cyanobacterium]|nr:cyanoexosortase A system-associated protein [Nostocaceae cyanobacterium]
MQISIPEIEKAKQVTKSFIKTQRFYLFGIITTLAILHLSIINNHPIESEEIYFYALGWIGILLLLWRNREHDEAIAGFSSLLGIFFLFLVILRPLHFWNLDLILFRISPIIAALGFGLLAFGFLGIKHHWRSFLLLCLMLFPYGFINDFLLFKLNFNEITATISAFALHYLGFKATYQGALIFLPTGTVEVLYFCTGGLLIVWLFKISLLLMVIIYPLSFWQKLGLIIGAFITGFLTGCVRVALLAVVVHKQEVFDYWHSYTGGHIFLTASTIIYAIFCTWLLPVEDIFWQQTLQKTSHSLEDIRSETIHHRKKSFSKWRLPLLATTWIGIVITAVYLMVNKAQIAVYQFPDTLTLDGWEQVSSASLDTKKNRQQNPSNDANNRGLEILQSGKQYRYFHKSIELKVKMLYAVNSRGNQNPFLTDVSKKIIKEKQPQIKQSSEIGYYTLYSDDKQAFLTACINPRGGSTATSAQFMKNRYTYDLTWNRLVLWIFGQEILRDNRCLWTQLSVSLNDMSITDAYAILESNWTHHYKTWQELFLLKHVSN